MRAASTDQAIVQRLQGLIPSSTLGRLRLGAVVLACVSVVAQLFQIGTPIHSAAWDMTSRVALALIIVGFVTTYVRGRVWWFDPLVMPLLIAVAGSGFNDPFGTIGLTVVLLVVQSLYGTFRSWIVRTVLGMASLPAALVFAPTPIGALEDIGRSLQTVPQIVLVTVLTRAIYSALGRQERAAAREALLARTGSQILAATEHEAVIDIAVEASRQLIALSPGTAIVIMDRIAGGYRVRAAIGTEEELDGRTYPEQVLTDPARYLAPSVPWVRHWHVEEIIAGERWRLLGGIRAIPEPVIDAFRTLGTQVRLGEASLHSHAELDYQANHDSLTDLPTRAKFFRELITAVDGNPPGSVALLNIDLDDFKQVNDVYGHGAGDELLVEVAQRIAAESGGHGVAGRMGGDEFVLLLTGLAEPGEAEKIAERLCARLVQPMRLTEATVRVGASIGVALTAAGVTASELSRRADIAMYAAKARGKNRVEMFTPDEHGDVARYRLLEDQLPHALERGEIHVYYQPYLDVSTLEWAGVEALVQWQHPTMGAVNCRELLALAERTGDIGAVTRYFLRNVAAEIGGMPGGDGLRLGINLSGRQLFEPRFADTVLETLAECGLPPDRLTLEIVESEQIDDPRARERLDQLAARGVRIALDDFGTGYVSLAALRAFPIHQLKVDGAFLGGNPEALDLVLSVGALLGTETLVQGVTTAEQLELVRGTTATTAQGELLAPIVSAAELRELLEAGHPVGLRTP